MFKNIIKGFKGAVHKLMEQSGIKKEYREVYIFGNTYIEVFTINGISLKHLQ